MALLRTKYHTMWTDSFNVHHVMSFWAKDDQSAIDLATLAAAVSKATLDHLFAVVELGPVTTHAAVAGSNGFDRCLFLYESEKKKAIRVSVPAFDSSLYETPGNVTKVDRIEGLTHLRSRNGTVASKFIQGRNQYRPRK